MRAKDFSRYVRRVHMYLALFLTPWVIVYAVSSLIFNHYRFVRDELYGGELNRFVQEKTMAYQAAFPEGASAEMIANQVLSDLGLEGTHFVRGKPNEERIVITRQDPLQVRRIIYFPREDRLVVKKNVFQTPSFLTRIHVRHGYQPPYFSAKLWAGAVDLVVFAMVFWVVSGLWMWWEIKPARKWGAVCVAAGLGMFGLFLFTI